MSTTPEAVWAALGTVLDPEIDEPITTLGFVASCTVSEEGVAAVRLRLPTFFCAPNFSFLMVADAHDAVSAVPGVTRNNYQIQAMHPKSLTQVNCPGPRVRPADLRTLEGMVRRLRPAPSALVCSGSLPPGGIEVQVLDNGFTEQYEKSSGRRGDWFTTHGDVFPVGSAKMKPFEPTSPDGSRSFPRKNLSRGAGQWNHYYVRAINGEIRLWVNGEEVSGGNECEPRSGYLCLESEGAPVEFRGLRIRGLP